MCGLGYYQKKPIRHGATNSPNNFVPIPWIFALPCRLCQASGTPCIFEKPEKKNVQGLSTASIEYAHLFLYLHLLSHISVVAEECDIALWVIGDMC